MMKSATKVLTLSTIAGVSLLVSASAAAWWSDDSDYWDGPWGYPGYGGWGGYPGYGGWGGYPGYYGGWGGYPGYGGWGGYPGYGGWGSGMPQVIITQPQESGGSESRTIR
jgi:hypothetical protein